jgi:hypothetical protein
LKSSRAHPPRSPQWDACFNGSFADVGLLRSAIALTDRPSRFQSKKQDRRGLF